MRKWIIIVVLLLTMSALLPQTGAAASDWKYVERGMNYMKAGNYTQAVEQLKLANAIAPKASTYRSLAISYEKLGQYQNAANAYYAEAELHKKRGATNDYLATLNKAEAWNSEVDTFMKIDKVHTGALAKYEPASGMYIGAYIEQDPISKQSGNKYKNFNQTFGKQHAIFFNYHTYENPFPKTLAENIKQAGGALQIALEPEDGLQAVQDNAYLRQFARDAKASNMPIFLRFASEMNGDWVAWTGNPSLYRQKFQLVAKVMREEAPNVAMVWSPNSIPAHNIHDYYPGDDVVDWVGMNLYSVPYFNGDPSQSAAQKNPLDYLDVVYDTYASRKPMMISEFGASYYSKADFKDHTKFAQTKMRLFYQGLKMKYPRVKAIHWFSVDTFNAPWVSADRKINNYSLTQNAAVKSTYSQVIQDPYYLSNVQNGTYVDSETTGVAVTPLQNAVVRSQINGSTYVKTYDPYVSKVVYMLNGKKLSESTTFPYTYQIDYNALQMSNQLKIDIYDSQGRVATSKMVAFKKGAAVADLTSNEVRLHLNDALVYSQQGVMTLAVAPYEKDGRTVVPLRFVSETLGATVKYDASTKGITIQKGETTLRLTIGSSVASVNGQRVTLDAAPFTNKGNTFVPLRFVGEALHADIAFHKASQVIHLKK